MNESFKLNLELDVRYVPASYTDYHVRDYTFTAPVLGPPRLERRKISQKCVQVAKDIYRYDPVYADYLIWPEPVEVSIPRHGPTHRRDHPAHLEVRQVNIDGYPWWECPA